MVCLFDVLMILPDILEKYFSEFSLKKNFLTEVSTVFAQTNLKDMNILFGESQQKFSVI